MDNIKFNKEFFEFVAKHILESPSSLRLRCYGISACFDIKLAIDQVECRQKASYKLPEFVSYPDTVFPTTLSYEQASNEKVAKFHSFLCKGDVLVLDMTAGLGIDALALSRVVDKVVAIDIDNVKAEALRHNCRVMGIGNLDVVCADSVVWLCGRNDFYDTIFIDPARRDTNNRRTYAFSDCVPDIVSALPMIMTHCRRLLIKSSPLLDISQVLREIPGVEKVYVVSVDGDCKELLVEVVKDGCLSGIEAVSIRKDGKYSSLFFSEATDHNVNIEYWPKEKDVHTLVGMWLYEPDPSIMKVGRWNAFSMLYPDFIKASPNTHLFLSSRMVPDFMGRVLKIESIISSSSSKSVKGMPFNVAVRNYPMSAESLKRKMKVSSGKDSFIYGFRIGEKETPLLITASRI